MDPQIDDKVAKLLGGLKRINAPDNFESRVNARLSTAPVMRNGFGWLKLALPTAALVGLAVFLFLSGYFGGEVPNVDVISATNETRGFQPPLPAQNSVPSNVDGLPREFREPEVAITQPPSANQQPSIKAVKNSNRVRSQDSASDPENPILPKGFNTNQQTGGNSNSEREMRRPSIAATDLLRYTGVTAEFRANEMTVNAIVKNSVAERIGVKAGDVIVSLNEIRMNRSTAFPSGVDLKTIRVRRNGSIVELKF